MKGVRKLGLAAAVVAALGAGSFALADSAPSVAGCPMGGPGFGPMGWGGQGQPPTQEQRAEHFAQMQAYRDAMHAQMHAQGGRGGYGMHGGWMGRGLWRGTPPAEAPTAPDKAE